MYDIKKRVIMHHVTVGSLIDALSKYPRDAKICCCGDDLMFIHVETDDSVVNIDTEDLDDNYIADDKTIPSDYWKNKLSSDEIRMAKIADKVLSNKIHDFVNERPHEEYMKNQIGINFSKHDADL